MSLFSSCTRLLRPVASLRGSLRGSRRRSSTATPHRPRLELLEDRCVPAVSVTEFGGISSMPPANPYGIVTGPDGNLWFTEYSANQIARLNPTTGVVTEYSQGLTPLSGPEDITVGPDGNLWFTENLASQIGSINPSTGQITEYGVNNGISANSGPTDITTGPDGNLWFTENYTTQNANVSRVASFNPGFSTATEYSSSKTPNFSANSGPFDITTGPDGNLWFTENTANKIGRITVPASPGGGITVTEFGGLANNAAPQGITAGPDGNLWFTENGANQIGRITTSGTVTEFSNTNGSDPRDIAIGPDANLWFTEGNASAIASITTSGTVTQNGSGISPMSTPQDITMGPDGNLWFTEYSGNRIARVQGIPAATGITLTSYSDNTPPAYGDTVVLTATVSSRLNSVTGPTSGVVLFRDGSRLLGAAAVSGGIAVYSTDALTAGTHQITASFSSSASYAGSTSSALTVQVAAAGTSTSVTSSASPSPAGQLVTYVATVSNTDADSDATPTGYVTFTDGSTVIGTSTLSGGLAVISTTPTVAGSHTINATYTPTANFLSSGTDAPWTQQIGSLAVTQVLFGQQPTFALAGTPFSPPVTAYFADMYGNLVDTPGIITLALAHNPTAAALGGFTSQFAPDGVATFAGVFVNKGGTGYTLSATSQGLTSAVSTPFTIGSATHFAVSAPTSVKAGIGFNVTVTAVTAYGYIDSLYQGTVQITSNDPGAPVLVASYTFLPGDHGRHTFTGLMLQTPTQAGHPWTITVTDSLKATLVGRAMVAVAAPSPTVSHLTAITFVPRSMLQHTNNVFYAPLYPFAGWLLRR